LFAIYLLNISIIHSLTPRSFIRPYTDDIILIAHSISELQSSFNNCERELEWLDVRISVQKCTVCTTVLDITLVAPE